MTSTPPSPASLQGLLDRCKCGVFLTVNEHRDYYQTAEKRLEEIRKWDEDGINEIPADVKAKMIAMNTVVELQFLNISRVANARTTELHAKYRSDKTPKLTAF